MFRVSGPAGQFKVVVYKEDGTVREVLSPFPNIVQAKEAIGKLSYRPFKAEVVPLNN